MSREETIGLSDGWGRDEFLRSLLRELAGTLESVVGLEDAEGFISVVGQRIGDRMNRDYRIALDRTSLDRKQVSETLVDLKRRIDGDFYVVEESDERIVLANRRCPFGDFVKDRPSLCMMTSNVFGTIAGENLGYARVSLEQTIAQGHAGCRVVIDLVEQAESLDRTSREYFGLDGAHEDD